MITRSYLPLGFPATTTATSDLLGLGGMFSCRHSLILGELRDRLLNLDLSISCGLAPILMTGAQNGSKVERRGPWEVMVYTSRRISAEVNARGSVRQYPVPSDSKSVCARFL